MLQDENPMKEPMKVVFHGRLVTMKYPWNAFIGHEQVSFGFLWVYITMNS